MLYSVLNNKQKEYILYTFQKANTTRRRRETARILSEEFNDTPSNMYQIYFKICKELNISTKSSEIIKPQPIKNKPKQPKQIKQPSLH